MWLVSVEEPSKTLRSRQDPFVFLKPCSVFLAAVNVVTNLHPWRNGDVGAISIILGQSFTGNLSEDGKDALKWIICLCFIHLLPLLQLSRSFYLVSPRIYTTTNPHHYTYSKLSECVSQQKPFIWLKHILFVWFQAFFFAPAASVHHKRVHRIQKWFSYWTLITMKPCLLCIWAHLLWSSLNTHKKKKYAFALGMFHEVPPGCRVTKYT